jgi:hypothetical protein
VPFALLTTDTAGKGLETLIMLHMTGRLDAHPAARLLPAEPVEPEAAPDAEDLSEPDEAERAE